jgi:hypothetical protein
MYNLIVLGSGRSGTSMVAGLFAKAGYFMGNHLWGPDKGNPKGYFEGEEINSINEDILQQVLPRRPRGRIGNLCFPRRPGRLQMWLARVPVGQTYTCPDPIKRRICSLTAREPFCFKDPRFSYTLPCWRPFLRDTRFLVVFRHPADTARSTAKECKTKSSLRRLAITRNDILEVWQLMYSHILRVHRAEGSWLFVHYNQIMERSGLDLVESFSGAAVDRTFPDKSLKHSISNEPVPPKIMRLYEELCALANYEMDALVPDS